MSLTQTDQKLTIAKGDSSKLDDIAVTAGQILITTDTCEMYVDLTDDQRKKIQTDTLKTYQADLTVDGWYLQNGFYYYSWKNEDLRCGKEGNVPPIITWITNVDEYSKITNADASPYIGILFECSEKPVATITLSVTDAK